ncbi:MAG: TetR/AcrR family transcriptional regulator, partial [Rhodoferax sp.]|nr:TetR/AcrR family transcriptional regulator [Rhodoferax sp.]
EGSSRDMLRYALFSWWELIGSTKASGIPKLMMSEAGNFPELVAFYRQEVIEPGNALLARILQRGMARGEFHPIDLKYGVFLILAPLLFLVLWKHSFGPCCDQHTQIDPVTYLETQLEMLLHGLSAH